MSNYQKIIRKIETEWFMEPETEIYHIDFVGNWLKKQPNLNFKMRTILIEWLCDVAYSKNCLNAIPFAIFITDYYLNTSNIFFREYYQLLGICALSISNFILNNMKNIDTDYCVFVCDKAYNENEIDEMFVNIVNKTNNKLHIFNFNINKTTTNSNILKSALTSLTPRYTYKKLQDQLNNYFGIDELEVEDPEVEDELE